MHEHEYSVTVNREYKDTLFHLLFGKDRKALLELYNGLNGSHYTDENALEINTLEGALYLGLRNDVSFVLDHQLNLYEHQSTLNPNMPLRDLFYVADLYQKMTVDKNIYGSRRLSIPCPRFVVLYNGRQKAPARSSLLLSDLYQEEIQPKDASFLELKVDFWNLKAVENEDLLGQCKKLKDYVDICDTIRKYLEEYPDDREYALDQAIEDCISRGIQVEFLRSQKAEVIKVSLYEFDLDKFLEMEHRDAYEEGREEGQEVIFSVIQDLKDGQTPEAISMSRNVPLDNILRAMQLLKS